MSSRSDRTVQRLAELAASYHVVIERPAHEGTDLVLTLHRAGEHSALGAGPRPVTYVGEDLVVLVARAWAGEPGDR